MGLAPRVACAEHGVVVAQVPWAEPDSRLTSGFEMECAWPAAVASQKTAGGFPRIAWRTAGHIARRVAARLESSMPCMFDGPTAIGVDETSHRKGHTYITVAVDHKRRRVAWAHDGYGKEVPGLFLRQPTDEQRASIKAVTGDGAEWIDASVKERLPNAGRVPDSFHIVSRMSDAPDQVRKRLRNQARRGNDKTATEAMRGVRYAVPKNPEDLTERQDTDPRGQPYRSWQLKELLGTLPHQPVGQAGAGLERWIFRASHSRIPEVVEPCRKTRRRKDDIPKNHQTRPLQRQARGIQQQDQGHHPHGLRLPTRRRPHRHDQTPMQRPTHPPTNTHPLTHENSRRLIFLNGSCEDVDPKSWLQRKVAYHGIWENGKIWQIMLTD